MPNWTPIIVIKPQFHSPPSHQHSSSIEPSSEKHFIRAKMKTTFFSLFVVLCLVYCFAHTSSAAVPCGTVDMKAASCIMFASGKAAKPSAACCTGLRQLADSVKTVDDKKAICRCLKAGVKNFPGVEDKFLSQIPTVCSINVGFRVSLNTDCERLH